jgi:hypothetical protein
VSQRYKTQTKEEKKGKRQIFTVVTELPSAPLCATIDVEKAAKPTSDTPLRIFLPKNKDNPF